MPTGIPVEQSNVAFQGFLLMACLFAELEEISGYNQCADLRSLWTKLVPIHDGAKSAYQTRYKMLLKIK